MISDDRNPFKPADDIVRAYGLEDAPGTGACTGKGGTPGPPVSESR
jgi:hypothetical protein